MTGLTEPITDIEEYLDAHERKSLLRFITCGSVDDGKSTLIGRLLYDSKMIFEDQLAALEDDSRRVGTQGQEIDFALLVDGLAAEREQGITIDVAYRFFSTEKRKFIVADTPGHEQYTRNMVTGASTADAAVILIDARRGVLTQTHRHSYLASLLGIRHIVVAINKMDLIDDAEIRFREIEDAFREFAAQLAFDDITCIPVSALRGDNVVEMAASMPWYRGPSLLGFLESVPIDEQRRVDEPLRMPVQWVNRPDQHFRGYAGTLASGSVRVGERIRVQPSARESIVARIVSYDGDLDEAIAGQSITLTLQDEIDVSRGDIISAANDAAEVADQFDAMLVWMDANALLPGRPYLLKIGSATINANVSELKYKVQVNTLEHIAAKTLELNEIGSVNLALDQPIAFDPYTRNRETGGFILIDRISNATVGAGMLNFALRRASNIHLQALDVDQSSRTSLMGHRPCVLWFTGLSGAGKSTIANAVEKLLLARGCHTYLLDGDNVR
ncbi:MAG: sulfate adenylyltransferase subunit CysN, partial [Jatrophihabitantaceae bacterium]